MATSPVTYRISPEVDAELKRLAKIHGGTDKALRVLLGLAVPLRAPYGGLNLAAELTGQQPARAEGHLAPKRLGKQPVQRAANFKGPLLKPKDRK